MTKLSAQKRKIKRGQGSLADSTATSTIYRINVRSFNLLTSRYAMARILWNAPKSSELWPIATYV
jgi:hypothetical protein